MAGTSDGADGEVAVDSAAPIVGDAKMRSRSLAERVWITHRSLRCTSWDTWGSLRTPYSADHSLPRVIVYLLAATHGSRNEWINCRSSTGSENGAFSAFLQTRDHDRGTNRVRQSHLLPPTSSGIKKSSLIFTAHHQAHRTGSLAARTDLKTKLSSIAMTLREYISDTVEVATSRTFGDGPVREVRIPPHCQRAAPLSRHTASHCV